MKKMREKDVYVGQNEFMSNLNDGQCFINKNFTYHATRGFLIGSPDEHNCSGPKRSTKKKRQSKSKI